MNYYYYIIYEHNYLFYKEFFNKLLYGFYFLDPSIFGLTDN